MMCNIFARSLRSRLMSSHFPCMLCCQSYQYSTVLADKLPRPVVSSTSHHWNKFHIIPIQKYSNKELIATSFNVQTEDDFESRVLHAKIPIIVDFHAEWCGPCKQLGPRLEKAVDFHSGNVMLAKVDIDDFGDLAMKYKIMAVPTVMLFKNGKAVDSFQGSIDDDELEAFVDRSLN